LVHSLFFLENKQPFFSVCKIVLAARHTQDLTRHFGLALK